MLILDVFTQVLLPILVMFGAGWALDRKWNLDLATVVKLNINIFVPAFIFYELCTARLDAALAGKVIGFTMAEIGAMFLLAGIVGYCKRATHAEKRSLQIAAMFYNSANYGIPLMALAFPHTAPGGVNIQALQVFVILVHNIGNFTLGIFLVSSAQTPGWRAVLPMLRQASVWSVAIALVFRWLHGPMTPDVTGGMRWLWMPVKYFHDGLVAVALLTLGVQLSKTAARSALPRLGRALILRLVAGPLAGWGLAIAFGFEGDVRNAMILSTSFPTAVNTALIAHEFKADTHYATGAVFWSTLLSMITVTTLIVILKTAGADPHMPYLKNDSTSEFRFSPAALSSFTFAVVATPASIVFDAVASRFTFGSAFAFAFQVLSGPRNWTNAKTAPAINVKVRIFTIFPSPEETAWEWIDSDSQGACPSVEGLFSGVMTPNDAASFVPRKPAK